MKNVESVLERGAFSVAVTLATPDRPVFCHRALDTTSLQLITETIARAKNERRDLFFFFPPPPPQSDDGATLFFFSYGNSIIRLTQMCRESSARGNVSTAL